MTVRDPLCRISTWAVAIALSCNLLAAAQAGAAKKPFFVELVEGKDVLVVAFDNGLVQVLSVPDLATVRELDVSAGARLEGIAVSGNGRWLAAATQGGDLGLWDLDSAMRRFSLPGPPRGGERSFLFHPRDDVLLLFQEGRLQLWDVQGQVALETLRGIRRVERMSISPDGRYLAVAGWCHGGCGDFGLCVLGLEERLMLAAGLEVFDGGSSDPVADLAYTVKHRIALTDADGWTRLLTAGTLTGTNALMGTLGSGALLAVADQYPAIRSAPRDQPRHQSFDGAWRVNVSTEGTRLFLYRRVPGDDPERGFDLEKMLALQ